MNEATFIKRMNWISTGDSFLVEKEIPLSHIRDITSFQSVMGASAGAVAATGVLTVSDNADDLDEIRIGPYSYFFDATTLVDVPFHVLIAASASLTLDNLIDAINNTGSEGTDYGTLTPQNSQVSAAAGAGDTIDFTARVAGEHGNSIPTAGVGGPGNDGLAGQSWSEATFGADALTGGTGAPGNTTVIPSLVTDGLSFNDGDTAFLQFTIPQDYAEGKDQCALRLHVIPSADASHTTDIGVTTAQSIFRAGVAVITTVRAAASEDATASTDQLAREAVLDLSDSGFQPGDVVKLTLDVNNSGTTELILTGMQLIYGSNLAAYNDDDRFRAMGSNEV